MCDAAGIIGHKTNLPLRATATTCSFKKGVDEQMTMHIAGHRNMDGSV